MAFDHVEKFAKVVSLLTDLCKFVVLVALTVFAITAVAAPARARQVLTELGLRVSEVNVFGVKLVASQAYDAADALVQTRISLNDVRDHATEADSKATVSAVTTALGHVAEADAALSRQELALKNAQFKAGVAAPVLPTTGWLYVGYQSDNGNFVAGPRIDAKATRIDRGNVTSLALKYDASVVSNGQECVLERLDEVVAPTPEQLQQVTLLLSASNGQGIDVLETARCDAAGKGKTLYAKIEIPKDGVRFVKFSDAPR